MEPIARDAAGGLDGAGEIRGGSGEMFDRIAGRYDLLNRILSLGVDRLWRWRTVRALALEDGHRVLDLATGTADMALEIARRHPGTEVVGLDPSARMLEVGRRKLRHRGLGARVSLREGDAQSLPFDAGSFDRAVIAFGIRNVPDRGRALAEIARVVRPGGRVAILELSEPRSGLPAALARFHIHTVVPRLGAWLSGEREYRYLERSIAAFPPPEEFAELMHRSGLEVLGVRPMTLGTTCLFVGRPLGGGG